jgi:NADPH:quinone reductase-like Zn-dependent oxidoreductase
MVLKPKTLPMREAAALPLIAITVQAIRKGAPVVCRSCFSSWRHCGVGYIGVQLAKALGCQVATTVDTNEDFDLVRRWELMRLLTSGKRKWKRVERLTSGFGSMSYSIRSEQKPYRVDGSGEGRRATRNNQCA